MSTIDDHLKLLNSEGAEYKILVRDSERDELTPVQGINDINQGALHNALEWLRRYARRINEEFPLVEARGEILQEWSKFWGIPNTESLDDPEFAQFIIGTVLAKTATLPVIQGLFEGQTVQGGGTLGPFFNHSFFGVPASPETPRGSTFSHPNNALYIFVRNYEEYNPGILRAVRRSRAAGIGIFITLTEISSLGDTGARKIGPFFNNSYFGVRSVSSGVQGATLTTTDGGSYLFFSTLADFDPVQVSMELIQQRPPIRVYSSIENP